MIIIIISIIELIPLHWYTTCIYLLTPGHGFPSNSSVCTSCIIEHVFLDWHLSTINFQAATEFLQYLLVERFEWGHVVKSYRPKSATKISIVSLPAEQSNVSFCPLQMVAMKEIIAIITAGNASYWQPSRHSPAQS